MDSWISWYKWIHNFLKLISIVENWISCSKINESAHDFMKKIICHEILFCYCRIQRTNENNYLHLFFYKNYKLDLPLFELWTFTNLCSLIPISCLYPYHSIWSREFITMFLDTTTQLGVKAKTYKLKKHIWVPMLPALVT